MTKTLRTLAALVVAAALGAAARSGAESNGVPLIDGAWEGKMTAVYFDQTIAGAVHPKQKYAGDVSVTIDQTGGALALAIMFSTPLLITAASAYNAVMLEGSVGNGHLSIGNGATDPPILGSGKINKTATQITLRGVFASLDYTYEFTIKLKRAPG